MPRFMYHGTVRALFFFFFQAEDGIRDYKVTGVQTCALPIYGARSGLTGFVAGLARSGIAAKGVTINNLLPGKFDTDRLRTTFTAAANKSGKSLDDVRLVQQSQVPARRFGSPDEFGAICAFLCSAHAGYMTGQNILPDGGLYAGTF